MGRADEAALWRNIHRWLAPGAGLLIDGPDPPAAESGQATRQFADGVLTINWRYDPERRIQHIEPLFVTSDGQEIELLDPYDPLQPEHTGVIRRIQSVTELSAALGLGFTVAVADPAWRADVWLLLARPKVSQG